MARLANMSERTLPPPGRARFHLSVRIGSKRELVEIHELCHWTIGRSADNSIHIEDPSVSRRHARLHCNGDVVELEDLGSSNGTLLTSAPTKSNTGAEEAAHRLVPGQRLRLRVGDGVRIGPALLGLEWRTPLDRARDDTIPPLAPPRVLVDPAMQALDDLVSRAARRDLSVLILGETGVGKELIAAAVHRCSARAHRQFLILNCAALPENLIESELFGHERGAFTGAHAAQPGLLEESDGGTVFLDEIGELPLGTQAKLLRVFEERTVLRLGAKKPRQIDVRFVTATNRNLLAEVQAGRFRSDFYHRLSGLVVHVPPLRERPSEIEPLAHHFLNRLYTGPAQPAPELTAPALAVLQRHAWPGNVRELRNVIERAAVLADDRAIGPAHIVLDPVAGAPAADPWDVDVPTRVNDMLPPSHGVDPAPDDERARVIEALAACAGNQRKAAELLGISRRTLVNRLNKWNLPRPKKPRHDSGA